MTTRPPTPEEGLAMARDCLTPGDEITVQEGCIVRVGIVTRLLTDAVEAIFGFDDRGDPIETAIRRVPLSDITEVTAAP